MQERRYILRAGFVRHDCVAFTNSFSLCKSLFRRSGIFIFIGQTTTPQPAPFGGAAVYLSFISKYVPLFRTELNHRDFEFYKYFILNRVRPALPLTHRPT